MLSSEQAGGGRRPLRTIRRLFSWLVLREKKGGKTKTGVGLECWQCVSFLFGSQLHHVHALGVRIVRTYGRRGEEPHQRQSRMARNGRRHQRCRIIVCVCFVVVSFAGAGGRIGAPVHAAGHSFGPFITAREREREKVLINV